MTLHTYPKTVPRPVATKKFKEMLTKGQLKRLKTQQERAEHLATVFKNGEIIMKLEHLGYEVVVKDCMSSTVNFRAVGYKIDNTWNILSVITVEDYEKIIRKFKGEPMVQALIGGNIHLRG